MLEIHGLHLKTIYLAQFPLYKKDIELQTPAPLPYCGALQVLMSSPYKGEGRGIAMLNLLRTLSQSIAPSMADMWEQEIPLLVQYLEGEVPTLCACWGTHQTCDLNDRNLGAGGPE